MNTYLVDCTLRDGGYYNGWDFDQPLIESYLESMQACGVDIVELGFRSLKNEGFKGACAYTTDSFISNLNIPIGLTIGVMVNASELLNDGSLHSSLADLFPNTASASPVDIVRIACHVHEFEKALPAATWLHELGYKVGFNLMQVSDRSEEEIKNLAALASGYPLDVLYFADSMGSMSPQQTADIIGWLRDGWKGPLGIHTHDNLGLALSNTLRALAEGVEWVDATVTGMGRGPGNARTEELAIEVAERRGGRINLVPLMKTIGEYFQPLKDKHRWGSNPFYYLAGKYGIHPSYIQEMLSDSRYNEEDVLEVIEHLRLEGGKKFSMNTLDASRQFYKGEPKGDWNPRSMFEGREVLLLGTGPGVTKHRSAVEKYIALKSPIVFALNTQSAISADLIDVRIACHPTRLLADCDEHADLPQPLITPFSMLPDDVRSSLGNKEVLDFGLAIEQGVFGFSDKHCVLPCSLVAAYALAVLASGRADKVLMVGFDGYGEDDPRNREMNGILKQYRETVGSVPLVAVTPTRYELDQKSIYGMIH
ncbi:aldolase [Marinobacter lipolyticus]|uniref:aldolase n=1 Tax=Marinobacter lipolyticus TaxID=209639 RepID=UPI003A92FAB8